ncbi:MAG: hypothetical protein EOP60_14355, partial [Sphingomonadales bacterium]
MAQLNVHPTSTGILVVDCQHDALSHLDTRIVIPLMPAESTPPGADRLHPIVDIDGRPFVLATQFLASVPRRDLKGAIASVEADRYAILG